MPAWKVRDRRFFSCSGIQVSKNKMFPPCSIVKIEYCGQFHDRELTCRRPTGLNFESCVWRAVSPHSYHHPQEVLQAQFSLYEGFYNFKPQHCPHLVIFNIEYFDLI